VNIGSLRVNGQLAAITPLSWNAETSKEEMQEIMDRLDRALSFSPLNSYILFLLADVSEDYVMGSVSILSLCSVQALT
jgi:hypothetical protein